MQKTFGGTISKKLSLPTLCVIGLFLSAMGSCQNSLTPDAYDGVFKLNAQKAKAEAAVVKLQGVQSDKPNEVKYAENLYNDARSQWNAWIATLQFAISTGQDIDGWAKHEEAAENAALTSERFLAEAEKIAIRESPTAIAATVITIGIELWNGWKQMDQAQRKLLSDELEKQKWLLFEQLTGKSSASS